MGEAGIGQGCPRGCLERIKCPGCSYCAVAACSPSWVNDVAQGVGGCRSVAAVSSAADLRCAHQLSKLPCKPADHLAISLLQRLVDLAVHVHAPTLQIAARMDINACGSRYSLQARDMSLTGLSLQPLKNLFEVALMQQQVIHCPLQWQITIQDGSVRQCIAC